MLQRMLHKNAVLSTLVVSSLNVLILLTVHANALSDEVKIVSPNEFAEREGDSRSADECCPFSFRYQQLFPARDFEALSNGGGLLKSIAWRPDGEAVTGPLSVNIGQSVLRLSIVPFEQLDDTFATNATASAQTTVLDRDVVIETSNLGPVGGPKEFDYLVEFDTPFHYDPSEGNLLFDWDIVDGFPDPAHLSDGFIDPAASDVRFAQSLDTPDGSYVGGLVQEFTFVPEPGSASLALLALVGMLGARAAKSGTV